MRRTEKEIQDKDSINEILSTALICRVGFSDDEYPYIIPMNYGYNNDALYFHCALDGKKIELLNRTTKFVLKLKNRTK